MSESPPELDHAVAITNLQRRIGKLEDLVRHQNWMSVYLLFATTFLFLIDDHLATILGGQFVLGLLAAGIVYVLYAVFVKPAVVERKAEPR